VSAYFGTDAVCGHGAVNHTSGVAAPSAPTVAGSRVRSVTPSSTFLHRRPDYSRKLDTMIVDALTYSSSPLLFMGIGQHSLIIYTGKNIVPERQRVYQVGFDYSLGSSPARHVYRSVHCSELSQAVLFLE
jgi:hypothetical protein